MYVSLLKSEGCEATSGGSDTEFSCVLIAEFSPDFWMLSKEVVGEYSAGRCGNVAREDEEFDLCHSEFFKLCIDSVCCWMLLQVRLQRKVNDEPFTGSLVWGFLHGAIPLIEFLIMVNLPGIVLL